MDLYYWFLVTTLFLDDCNGTFQLVSMVLCAEKCLEFFFKFTLPTPGLVASAKEVMFLPFHVCLLAG